MKFSIQAVYGWYRDLIRNPKYRWWVILGTALYFISPFDIAPDFLPIVGQIDDAFILTLLVSEVSQLVIEGFKARKGNTEVSDSTYTTTTASSQANTQTQTIDVDAVSVE
ncbi:hypothetical protein DSM106972_029790 [Dulcicalothrix desertica PCC 7102]|uniref:DUF1232 domain-containing protein n=1 Tax=Dulcicalothrix desertica PCC 7102 TaxID=232991 RepID=A0A433VL25_9CYAN|nr:YkvA family protein [Dulcicalothrix desertica]RUT06722.1 hypothetical protein DSM106972_029790 [Dulcicalothrix desertica PCC 7102]TWH50170.1 uncharacterized membrane protein YkvA (DUF1232 family) [Dulcicalothrix desertica PCC 7102]